jgi:hypothetical protein
MTRLHIQVNQTIQFYRGQQGGSAPERLYLSGGASIMPYTAQFFAEKLNLPVDYFNPFRNIEIGPALDLEELSKYAHSFGEVVGLGLRDLAHCPVELNLMPKSSIQRQEFAQKKPYLIAAIFSLALAVFLLDQAEGRIYGMWQGKLAGLKDRLGELTKKSQDLKKSMGDLDAALEEAKGVTLLSENHVYWMKMLGELRAVLLRAEASSQAALKAKTGGQDIDTGVWVEVFDPVLPLGSPYGGGMGGGGGETIVRVQRQYDPRLGYDPRRRLSMPGPPLEPGGRPMPQRPTATMANASTDTISNISLTCRLIDRSKISASANQDMAFAVQAGLNASAYFTNATLGAMGLEADASRTNTMTFTIDVGLKHPFKL